MRLRVGDLVTYGALSNAPLGVVIGDNTKLSVFPTLPHYEFWHAVLARSLCTEKRVKFLKLVKLPGDGR